MISAEGFVLFAISYKVSQFLGIGLLLLSLYFVKWYFAFRFFISVRIKSGLNEITGATIMLQKALRDEVPMLFSWSKSGWA